MQPFDPTPSDIKALNDVDLRELIVRLCHAEAHAHGLPAASVTAGGDQRASDGGIDIYIDGRASEPKGHFLRLPLGIQVKAQHMTDGLVRNEMRPHGALRQSIKDIATLAGAYIIASGRDDFPYEKLMAIRQTMAEAAQDASPNLLVDFYDASRLARWCARYKGVAYWLCQKVGRPTNGWAAFRKLVSPAPFRRSHLLYR